jgi:SAM-dependent methyltransferase
VTPETTDHVRRNRRHWEGEADAYQERNRSQLNRWDLLAWGVYDVPEDEVHALGDVRGLRALEYGCGGCQFGIKVAMRGARLTGIDLSATQLRHGLEHMAETGVRFPVVQADGEVLPFADGSFDLVFCDHGVMGFADPYRTVPEVARVLRPGGLFVFNGTTPWIWVAWGQQEEELPATREMRGDYFGLRSATFEDPEWATTEFQLTYGGWIRLFRANGLAIEDLIELRPAEDATTTYDYAPLDWARAFPAEHIWKVRKA